MILASGLSSRMKAFKPLLPVAGMPAVVGLIESAKAAGLDDITVVTGHNREELAPVLVQNEVKEAYNAGYEGGMMTSVRTGLAAALESGAGGTAGEDSKLGYLLMPVDCPLISTSILRLVMDKITEAAKDGSDCGPAGGSFNNFAVATFEGKKGHPLFVPVGRIQEICDYDGEGGLAAVTDKYAEDMLRIETGEEGCLLDMDTPEGYKDIENFVAKGFAREKLELLTARKRIFLVRHGETEQHDEPMFIGQYDVALSDEGRMAAAKVGDEIAMAMREDVEAEALGMDKFGREPMPAIERIYSSDLARAKETAEIIKNAVNATLPAPVEVKYDVGLREIDLGPWDGKPVSEVKAEFAEEYERRGRNMFTFKLRGMENFYDMQYRVLAAFREILRNDDAKDIIIVTHAGVIRALENNIRGGHVDGEWEPMTKGSWRMFEPFPEQADEKVNENKPMSSDELTMESLLEYYE
ncbi:MAG: histidine phosphatase family protein [Firmicutes bacterium]|nr:histidine phosphatase family protein [Bacillota bacterium]